MSGDEQLVELTRKLDVTAMEVEYLKSAVTRLEDEGLATRTAVIENELRTIRTDVEILPKLAEQISEMRSAAKTTRLIAGAAAAFLFPLTGWIYSTTLEALRQDIQTQAQVLNAYVEEHP
jgi:outer membrane murein-binding lipoprotein Lpp